MSTRPTLSPLEPRLFLAADPTPNEQYLLELINRARRDPAAEIARLVATPNQQIQGQLDFYHVDRAVLAQQAAALSPAPPLAWNPALGASSQSHAELLVSNRDQQYTFPGEPGLSARIAAAGYPTASTAALGENIHGFSRSPLDAHATFLIAWAPVQSGIFNPPFSRDTMLNPDFRDVGISFLPVPAGSPAFGPFAVTQDFASGTDAAPRLVGVVYHDNVTRDDFYTPGEGLAGLTVTATRAADNATFTTTTTSSGGYTLPIEPGTYTVTATGPNLKTPFSAPNVVVTNHNAKLDFFLIPSGPATGAPDLAVSVTAPKSLPPGKPQKLTVTLTNKGPAFAGPVTATAYFSTDTTIDAADFALPSVTFPVKISAKKTKSLTVPLPASLPLPAGNFNVLVKITSPADTNPANDSAAAKSPTQVIASTTNLVPTLSGKPKLAKNGSLPLTVKLKNTGNSTATGPLSFTLTARPTNGTPDLPLPAPTTLTLNLKPNATLTLKHTLPAGALPSGSYQLILTLNPTLTTAESNTTDNTLTTTPITIA